MNSRNVLSIWLLSLEEGEERKWILRMIFDVCVIFFVKYQMCSYWFEWQSWNVANWWRYPMWSGLNTKCMLRKKCINIHPIPWYFCFFLPTIFSQRKNIWVLTAWNTPLTEKKWTMNSFAFFPSLQIKRWMC